MKLYIPFFILIISIKCFAQKCPAQVKNPYIWITADKNKNQFILKNQLAPNTILLKKTEGVLINNHPSIFFDASQDTLTFNIPKINYQTIFLVYKVKDSLTEQVLWNISDQSKNITLTTTERLANLSNFKYNSLKNKSEYSSAIYFYQHTKSNLSDNNKYQISIGKIKHNLSIPARFLKGYISEIIMYDRFLNNKETNKIASYLAIKYGISLSQKELQNYTDSKGKIIWNALENKHYLNHVTAIGKDETSQLYQSKSRNIEDELTTIDLSSIKESVPDNSFLFWSDNAKPLKFKQEEGLPKLLERKWLMCIDSTIDSHKIKWQFNLKKITDLKQPDTKPWLVIDPTGKAKWDSDEIIYKKLEETSDGTTTLNNYNWDGKKNKKIVYTFQMAPDMFARVKITQPKCGISDGFLKYTIIGGKAPYTITLINHDTKNVVKKWIHDNNTSNIAVHSGKYNYIVVDASGTIYEQKIFISDQDITSPKLQETFTLNDTPIIINANDYLPEGNYQFQWFLNKELITNDNTIMLTNPGDYQLITKHENDCETVTNFRVEEKNNSKNNQIIALPNPSEDGHFKIFGNFNTITNATLYIYNSAGALITTEKWSGKTQYIYNGHIPASGVYIAKISTSEEEKSIKIIIK
ncbi:T9SS type A sorting domain-containing protein [Flavobacterium covae]|uniref:T9SS type A sorting domain-containing protein n=1 Tax=Flavobacterium covae TaxID=2906076 RepID=UPI0035E437B5